MLIQICLNETQQHSYGFWRNRWTVSTCHRWATRKRLLSYVGVRKRWRSVYSAILQSLRYRLCHQPNPKPQSTNPVLFSGNSVTSVTIATFRLFETAASRISVGLNLFVWSVNVRCDHLFCRQEAQDLLHDLAVRKQGGSRGGSPAPLSGSPCSPRRRRLTKTPSPDLSCVVRDSMWFTTLFNWTDPFNLKLSRKKNKKQNDDILINFQ